MLLYSYSKLEDTLVKYERTYMLLDMLKYTLTSYFLTLIFFGSLGLYRLKLSDTLDIALYCSVTSLIVIFIHCKLNDLIIYLKDNENIEIEVYRLACDSFDSKVESIEIDENSIIIKVDCYIKDIDTSIKKLFKGVAKAVTENELENIDIHIIVHKLEIDNEGNIDRLESSKYSLQSIDYNVCEALLNKSIKIEVC